MQDSLHQRCEKGARELQKAQTGIQWAEKIGILTSRQVQEPKNGNKTLLVRLKKGLTKF